MFPKLSHDIEGVTCIADAKIKNHEYLCYPFFPRSYISLVYGDGGIGKSSLAMGLTAKITNGKSFIGDEDLPKKMHVLICSAEDGMETIHKRLSCNGADLKNVCVFVEDNMLTDVFDSRLEECISTYEIDLVILDTITTFLGGNTNPNKASDVRPVLIKLQSLARRYNCSIVMIGHCNKRNISVLDRAILGSVEFYNVPRTVSLLCRHPFETGKLLLTNIKNNITEDGCQISYSVENSIVVDVKSDFVPLESLDNKKKVGRAEGKYQKSAVWLKEYLSSGPKLVNQLFEDAEKAGFSKSTIEHFAKNAVNAKSRWCKPENKHHEWYLPDDEMVVTDKEENNNEHK